MTDTPNNDQQIISSFADVQSLYASIPSDCAGKIGIEVERHVIKVLESGYEMAGAAALMSLQKRLRKEGYNAQLEAAGVLEYASPAVSLNEFPNLLPQIDNALEAFRKAAEDFGLRHAIVSVLPTATFDEAFSKMVARPRLQVGIQSLAQVSPHGAIAIPLLTAGVQVSFSPKDPDQMFRMARRAYALTPLLMAVMNSDTGYSENDAVKKPHHLRGHYYSDYGTSGGISEAFLRAHDGDSLIKNHYEEVIHALMYFAYNEKGELIPSTPSNKMTFASLPHAMKTRANYETAESFLYHDVKICNLRNKNGVVLGKRLEVRAADSGAHQALTTPLLTAALIPDGITADLFDMLLSSYGFTGDVEQDKSLYLEGRKNAVYHGGAYMDVEFGRDPQSGKPLRLLDFAFEVSDLIDGHYLSCPISPVVDNALNKLHTILMTGLSSSAELEFATFKECQDTRHMIRPIARKVDFLYSCER
jgi:hypothetical protein